MEKLFFEVTPDKEKAFYIQAGKTTVSVLGTSFNLKNNEDIGAVEVTVVTGKVAFYNRTSPEEALQLIPGDKGVFYSKNGRLVKVYNEDLNFLSWQTGTLKFDNASLFEVVNAISAHFGKRIHLANSNLGKCKITSVFTDQPLERVLMELHILLDIEYSFGNGEVVIFGKGCEKIKS